MYVLTCQWYLPVNGNVNCVCTPSRSLYVHTVRTKYSNTRVYVVDTYQSGYRVFVLTERITRYGLLVLSTSIPLIRQDAETVRGRGIFSRVLLVWMSSTVP